MEATDRILDKLDNIREDQVRAIETLKEIRHLVRTPAPAPSVSPLATSTLPLTAPVPTEEWPAKAMKWLTSGRSVVWLVLTVYKHLPMLGTVVYMKATGQDEKILAYINGLLGV